MGTNLLYVLEPLSKLFPRIRKPKIAISFTQKLVYTAIALFVYLICCQIPLYGVVHMKQGDPLYWTRVILASSKGTLMELGISPVITAGWILQFVDITGVLKPDYNSGRDTEIYTGLEKILAIIVAFGGVIGEIYIGAYGTMEQLGYSGAIIVGIQLILSTIMVILLSDMLKEGYGLGSGISLFILANTAENLFWKIFSPITLKSQYGIQFQGTLVCLVHFLLTKPTKSGAVYAAFTRTSSTNLSQLTGTIIMFFIVIYLQGIKTHIPLIHQTSRGFKYNFPVKLFFTSNMSAILQSMVASKFYELSHIIHDRFRGVFWIKLIGTWQGDKCIGGLAWWISPPDSPFDYFSLRGLTYTIFVCWCCAMFALLWIAIEKQTPRELAKQFRNQQLTLAGHRQKSVFSALNETVPTAAMLGGVVIGLLTILGDIFGVIGSSTGLLLSVNIIYGYMSKIKDASNASKSIKLY